MYFGPTTLHFEIIQKPMTIMLKRFTSILMFLLMGISLFAQVEVVAPSDACGKQDELTTFSIVGNDLTEIVGMEFTMTYDPAIVSVNNLTPNPALTGFVNASNPVAGTIIFSWAGALPGQSFPDGTALLDVEVSADGLLASSTDLNFTNLEVVTASSFPNAAASTSTDGSFTVECAAIGNPLVLTVDAPDAECDDDQYTIDILVDGFDTLNSVQFTLNWDPALLSYSSVGNFAPLNDFDGSDFGEFPALGQLTLAWFDDVNTLPDGSILFSVTFDVIGGVGAVGSISFGNNPTPIQAGAETGPNESTPIPVVTNDDGYNIIDTTPPEITCPDDLTITNILGEPSKIVNGIAPVSVSDNCGPFTVSYDLSGATTGSGDDDASGNAFNIGDTDVTYTVTDAGGNTAQCSFNVHVNDTLTITAVANPAQCGDDDYRVDFIVENFTDLKGLQFTLTWDASVLAYNNVAENNLPPTSGFGEVAPDVLTFSWFDMEDTGKSFPDGFVIFSLSFEVLTGVGTTSPMNFVNAPTPIEASLNGTVPPFEIPIRTNNATVNVIDNLPPDAPAPPADLNVQCATDVPAPVELTAEDLCDGPITVAPSAVITPGNCDNQFTIVRTWTFTDNEGNSSSVSQTINVNDTTAPDAPDAPADVNIQCASEVPAPIDLTAVDNCDGDITVSPSAVITPGSCDNQFTMVRTWTFTDGCGNSSSVSQTIVVNDDTAPVAPAAPADLNLQCASEVPAPVELTAVDNCDGDITVSPSAVITPGNCDNQFTVVRTWTFTDGCGNSSSVSQTINVDDTTAPDAPAAPADVNVQCATDVPAPVELTAVDNCDGDITVSPSVVITPGNCINNFTEVRTWTFTDGCGNSSSVSQTIIVNDDTAPVAPAAPADVNVQCATDVPAPIDLTAVDNCDGDITVSPSVVITPGNCVNNFTEVRTWTFTDVCGNSSSVSQTINVNDDTAPVITGVPADVTVECDNVPAPASPVATDNCGDVTIELVTDIIDGNCPDNFTIIDTWTATDACGNTTVESQVITVEDTTPPSFDFAAPQDETVQCAADVQAPFIPTSSDVSDNCTPSEFILIEFDEQVVDGSCPNNFTVNRTWTITDECGNSASITQVITVDDNTAPVAPAAPADADVQCAGDVPAPVELTAVDNCDGDITVSPTDVVTPGSCVNEFTVVRTWTFTDACGNSSSVSQTINVNDDTDPVLVGVPADETVECDNIPAAATVTATDNCGGVSVAFSESTTPGNCPNNFTITRTWTATDDCGNTSVGTQVVTVEDTTAPTFDFAAPQDQTVQCAGDVPPAFMPTSSDVSDNCSASADIDIAFDEQTVPGSCPNNFTVNRTWTITDECGNSASVTQTITVDDDTAPVVACQDVTIQLDEDGNASTSAADIDNGTSDNCGGFTLALSQTDFSCMNIGDNTVTLTATDDCGNSSACTATVTVEDNIPPTLFCPSNQTINLDPGACEAIVNYNVTATDNCEFMLTTTFLGTTFNDNNGFAGNMFNVENTGAGAITITMFDVNLDANPGFVATLDVYFTPDTYVGKTNNAAAWTLLGTNTAVAQGQGNPTELMVGGLTIQPGESYGIYINLASYNIVTNRFVYTNGNNTYSDANMTITTGVGKATPAFTGATFNSRTWNGNIYYTVQVGGPPLVEQIDGSGLTSGDFFPIGTTTQTWQATDNEGNSATCSWDITVAEFPNPIPTLVCNDELTVALDENCEAIIGADQILEGGPYGCYDDYIVEIFQGTTNLGDMVGADQVGMTLNVVVTDPETGNFCESIIHVVDNIPPTIECSDVTVTCTESTEPADLVGYSKLYEYPSVGGDDQPIPDGCEGGTTALEIPFVVDATGLVTDVDLDLQIFHSWVGDLSAELIAPDGTTALLFERPGSDDAKCFDTFDNGGDDMGASVDDIDASFDEQANNTALDFEELEIAGMGGTFQPLNSFIKFNGKPAAGTWVLKIYDAVNGGVQTGTFAGATLKIAAGAVAPPLAEDACGDAVLTYDDEVTDGDCDDDFIKQITRTWTATDESGNTAVCTQTITVDRPTVQDVDFPADLNDLELPALDCVDADTDPSNTGSPSIAGVELMAGDMCEIQVIYEDLVVEICEGSFKILRTWTVTENCTDEIATADQIIKVMDKTGPTLTCPEAITAGTNTGNCSADVMLPLAAVIDDCSSIDNITVTIEANAGTLVNGNQLMDVPVGTHIITYTAEDACGNTSQCTTTLTVEDDDPPVALCDEQTSVSLTSDGSAEVCWPTFDDGSYDNCEILAFRVKRADDPSFIPFTECVQFDCDDVGQTIMVRMRVYDVLGNFTENDPAARFNECTVEVTVDDKLEPVIVCPPNKTVDCGEYDPNVFDGVTANGPGAPVFKLPENEQIGFYSQVFDNCEVDRVNVSQNGGPDQCGEGTVTRIYTAVDAKGLTATCVQIITIDNGAPFNITDTNCFNADPNDGVEWPCDITLNSCGAGLDPDDLETNPAVDPSDVRPQIMEDVCDLVGVSFKDTELPITAPGCVALVRTWTVVDWCQPDPSFDLGYVTWTYNQEIVVLESAAPTISGCEDITIEGLEADCEPFSTGDMLTVEGSDDCTADEDLVYTYKIDAFYDPAEPGSPTYDFNSNFNPLADAGNEDNEANGSYPIGTHLIQWTVEDGCGNFTTCSYTFTVIDALPPTPICKVLHTVIMPSSQTVTISASSFENGDSYDNCTPYEELSISYSQDVNDTEMVFDCDDVGNPVDVTIYVTDEYGNFDFCETTLNITDPNNACNLAPTATIAGAVETELDLPVALTDVEVTSSNGANGPQMMTTGNDGLFSFDLPLSGNYTVSPEKDINYLNGVTTYDLVIISQHILGVNQLDSPYKIIAADASNDGQVTTFDIVELRKLILHIVDELPNNTSWRFVEEAYQFPNPANPFMPAFPEVININDLAQDELFNDFVGVKVGDVSGDVVPNNFVSGDDRNVSGDLIFKVDEQELTAGETYTVDFMAEDFNNMLGYQFTLEVANEAAEFVSVEDGKLPQLGEGNFGLVQAENGLITTSWNDNNVSMLDGDVLFSVTIRAKKNTRLSEVLKVNSRLARAEAYTASAELLDVALRFNGEEGSTVVGGEFALYQNQPNPFKSETTIGFYLPEATSATLKVYDVAGKVLQIIEGDYSRGYNTINLDRSELDAAGMLYYQLDTEKESAVKKMLIIE
jgi:subtilisin-like proprotein convertase family protein